ncbi:Hsp20/alpha crystallin family protein [Ramlibacter tataouinensis]|uniref:Small heat shock protein, HSP20 family-like protein n=1 Tax=Ramlibacter tataouinensis (strain ATCC BAA-407 / DSM 14655 / LMG 21543 / TTB310) TaxID=365046 RepID=F5Y394_RAMTT|nr:Hsp20/alpha crystallin family protein [Ramlibacter tataouinensis]AEG91181.1 small heat shock protein, HSP20 family-like protein [Ramlibacter tataouinensis TTB310]
MFFAPALRTGELARQPGVLDFGLERFLNDTYRHLGRAGYELQEDDKSWLLAIDVPGVAKEHLAVHVEGNMVRIETSREASRHFKAAYELPQEIDVDACEAKLENGVLMLRLAKLPQAQGRQVRIS